MYEHIWNRYRTPSPPSSLHPIFHLKRVRFYPSTYLSLFWVSYVLDNIAQDWSECHLRTNFSAIMTSRTRIPSWSLNFSQRSSSATPPPLVNWGKAYQALIGARDSFSEKETNKNIGYLSVSQLGSSEHSFSYTDRFTCRWNTLSPFRMLNIRFAAGMTLGPRRRTPSYRVSESYIWRPLWKSLVRYQRRMPTVEVFVQQRKQCS